MFIAYTKDNRRFVENADHSGRVFTWDDIPQDVNITALALTHPNSLIINQKRISPKVSIKKYHYYYFFNEATMSVVQSSAGGLKQEEASLVAKVIAGVDVEREYVLEIRLDRYGNTSCSSYPLSALINKLKNGHMRKSILKPGIDCADEKKLL